MNTLVQPIPDSAVAALEQGNKIEAIKIVRMERALGLKESKDVVDAYVRSNPRLEQALSELTAEASRKLGLWIALLSGVGLLAWFLLKPR